MKKHDNTLYVTTQGAYLARKGTNVVVRVERQTRMSLPVHTIGGIVCFGNVACSPFVMGLCGEAGVGISFHTQYGRFLARVHGPQSGNVILRRAQHRMTVDPWAGVIAAKHVVCAKIANARTVLQRALRDHSPKMAASRVEAAVTRLASLLAEMTQNLTLERIRGIEGDAARTYFGVFDEMIVCQKRPFSLHTANKATAQRQYQRPTVVRLRFADPRYDVGLRERRARSANGIPPCRSVWPALTGPGPRRGIPPLLGRSSCAIADQSAAGGCEGIQSAGDRWRGDGRSYSENDSRGVPEPQARDDSPPLLE